MNWKDLLIGIGCFVAAYLVRKFNKWTTPVQKIDFFDGGQTVRGWMVVIALIIAGIVFVFSSLPDSI
jgi:hypothetical protein